MGELDDPSTPQGHRESLLEQEAPERRQTHPHLCTVGHVQSGACDLALTEVKHIVIKACRFKCSYTGSFPRLLLKSDIQ